MDEIVYPLSASETRAIRWAARITPFVAVTVLLVLSVMSFAVTGS